MGDNAGHAPAACQVAPGVKRCEATSSNRAPGRRPLTPVWSLSYVRRIRTLIGRSVCSAADGLLPSSLAHVALQLTEICRASLVGRHAGSRLSYSA
jgi:hypothetical protein